MRVPSMPPWRTSATSVVPPPTSMKSAPDCWTCSLRQDARHGIRLGHDLEQLQLQLLGHGLERAEVNERREGVEDADPDVAALEADRVRDRVAVDLGAGDGRVDQPHVHLRQAGLPGDRPLGRAQRLALDAVDQLLQLGVGDRRVGALALLRVGRGEALDQLAGDPDHDTASAGSRPSPRLPGARPSSCPRRR